MEVQLCESPASLPPQSEAIGLEGPFKKKRNGFLPYTESLDD